MRALAVALLLGFGAARLATAEPAVGFDHIVHEGKVSVLGKDPIACTACHRVTAGGAVLGRPGHAACLGACHAPPARGAAPIADTRRVCIACHAGTDLDGRARGRVDYPPYRIDPDYGLAMSHAAHAAAGCVACHPTPGVPPRATAPHARCAPCHATRAAPLLSACTGCHLAAYGVNTRPRLQRGPLAVGAAFSHVRHAGRGQAGAACDGCHRGLGASSGLELPTPSTNDCATSGCHDGMAAFATTAACTRCHTRPPTETFVVTRPAARFSHDAHAALVPIDRCAACHVLDARGLAVTVGHAACTACHAADFAARTPTTCGACHVTTEPWRRLRADQLPPPSSDFGVELPHGQHEQLGCVACHQLTTATRELRPPRGHAACTGSGCHAAARGPTPPLEACAACHQRGLEHGRDQLGAARPWSVRARFRHAAHARDPRTTGPLACVACHAGMSTAADLAAIVPPPKRSCAPCHDGTTAFKLTGHGCASCHGR